VSAEARPRVAILTEQVKPGGKRSHVDALSAGLTALDWNVSLLDWARFSFLERATVALPGRVLNRVERALGHRWIIPTYDRILARRLARLLRDTPGIEVLSLHEAWVQPVARRVAPGVPVAFTVHGPLHREIASGYGVPIEHPTIQWIREFERRAYLESDAVVSVDRAHAEYVRSFGRTGPIAVIPNFVDTRRFHPGIAPAALPAEVEAWVAGRAVILCPRLLVPKNGVAIAVEAMRVLKDRATHAVLLLAGGGPQRMELESRVQALDLGTHVRFLGLTPSAAMPGLCRRAGAVIVPSVPSKGVEEATSIAAIEGQACGRAVVVSDLGGLREVVRDGTGLRVPPGDPGALADALTRVLEDDDLARRLGEAAVANVREHHSHEAGARRFIEVFRSILRPRRGAATDPA
jgi:glycosyltransferase involved in cell wall biosynthesis